MSFPTHTQGFIAAPLTPYDRKGEINYDIIPDYADHLKKAGVAGVFVSGTTGEGMLLSKEERIELTKVWAAQKDENFKIMIHIAHTHPKTSQQLIELAAQCQADAIAEIGPYYFKPNSVKELVEHCAKTAAVSPELPYYYYHMPSINGLDFSMLSFLERAAAKIPNLAGIKYTHYNLMDYTQCLNFQEHKFDLLFGRDEILLCALALGARGAVGSTYNLMTPLYLEIQTMFELGNLDRARIYQNQAIDIIHRLDQTGSFLGALKTLMNLHGLNMGKPRSPIMTIEETIVRPIYEDMICYMSKITS